MTNAPNAKELELLSEFRRQVAPLKLPPEHLEESFLLRWIRAREGNLAKSLDMLIKHIKWREEAGMATILSWNPPPRFFKDCYCIYLGDGYENEPVVWIPTGILNLKEIASRGEKQEFFRFVDWIFETVNHKVKGKRDRSGYPQTKFTLICEAEGFSAWNIASLTVIDMYLHVLKTFEANRPEILEKVHILHAGYFASFYNVIKHVIAPKTVEKIHFHKDNAIEEALKAAIPLEVLPVRYGGNNTIVLDKYHPTMT